MDYSDTGGEHVDDVDGMHLEMEIVQVDEY
jgi:hypothetical protein